MPNPSTPTDPDLQIPALVGHLARHFRIGAGSELTLLLGTGTERDNLAALATWVAAELVRMATNPVANVLEALETELLATLQRYDADQGTDTQVPSPLAKARAISGADPRDPTPAPTTRKHSTSR